MNRIEKYKNFFKVICILIFFFTCYILKLQGFTITTSTIEDEELYTDALEINNLEENTAIIPENEDSKNIEDDINQSNNIEQIEQEIVYDVQDDIVEQNIADNLNSSEEIQQVIQDVNDIKLEKFSEEEKGIQRIAESLKYIHDIKYENDEMIVVVSSIGEDAISNGSTLDVTEIKPYEDKYKELEDKLNEKIEYEENPIAGFIAYDIKLLNPEGIEIEPIGKVNVTFEYKNDLKLLDNVSSEDIDISVHHFEEDEQGKVKEVIDLADSDDVKKIDIKQDTQVSKVQFETESFSPFTITYRYKRYTWSQTYTNYVNVNVHFVNENGVEIESNQANINQTFETNSTNIADIVLSSYSNKLTGTDATKYKYIDAHYASYNGKTITRIVAYRNKDPSVSIDPNNIGCTVEFYNNDELVGIIEYESGNPREVDVYLVYADNSELSISDTIANDGCLTALTSGNIIPASQNVIYKWYRSTDGITYQQVRRIKVTKDLYNIPVENGPSINVALDEGSNKYYKVEKYRITESGDEDLLGESTYHVPYYSDVRNGSFENPHNGHPDTKLDSGSSDLIWKTTANDGKIEIAQSDEGRTDGTIGQTVSQENFELNMKIYHFAYMPDGTQAAELNANESGALYQDILSVPGSQMYWSLYHRARGREYTDKKSTGSDGFNYTGKEYAHTDVMYVVSMAKEAAEKYDITTQAKVLEVLEIVNNAAEKRKNGQELTEIEKELEDAEVVKITTTNNGNGIMEFSNGTQVTVPGTKFGPDGTVTVSGTSYSYIGSTWHYYSGHFSIPENQFLTRFFFVAGNTQVGDNSIGNLIDDIHVSDEMPPPNDGQATIRIMKNVVGLDELPSDYSVPIGVTYNTYNDSSNHSIGISSTTKNRNYNSYSLVYDENDQLTGERRQWHDYTLTIPPNGDGEIVSFKELSESAVGLLNSSGNDLAYSYQIDGLNLQTTYTVTKKEKNETTSTVIAQGSINNYEQDIQLNQLIQNGDFVQIEITNTYFKDTTNFAFIKQGEDPLGHGTLRLQGANFRLTQVVSGIDEIANVYYSISNSQGIVEFNDIKYGTYTLEELDNVSGYRPLEKTYTVVVNDTGVTIDGTRIYLASDFVILNELAKVTVNKLDESHNLLTKSVFNLKYDTILDFTRIDDESHDTYVGDDLPDGKLTFTNIKYSDAENKYVYTLKEIEAPTGYYKYNKEIKFYVTYDATNKKNIIHLDNLDEIQEYISLSDDLSEINVINTSRGELPVAGGIGINYSKTIGTIIIVFSFLILYIRMEGRKNDKE